MPTINEQLLTACGQGNVKEVKKLVSKQGADVSYCRKDNPDKRLPKTTPLYEACRQASNKKNKKEIIEFLLEHGADVNMSDSKGDTPLHHAVLNGEDETVALLLLCPAININQLNDEGETALYKACITENQLIAKKLIDAGALANQGDKDGITPLHQACQKHNQNIVNLLLECPGIQIDPTDNKGFTPLHVLSDKPYPDSAPIAEQLLRQGADINKIARDRYTPSSLAFKQLQSGYWDSTAPLVKLLLTHDNLILKATDYQTLVSYQRMTTGKYLALYTDNYLTNQRYEKAQFKADHPDAPFDFQDGPEGDERAALCFYMLQYLITQNKPLEMIEQLLFIPSVKFLAIENAKSLLKAADSVNKSSVERKIPKK